MGIIKRVVNLNFNIRYQVDGQNYDTNNSTIHISLDFVETSIQYGKHYQVSVTPIDGPVQLLEASYKEPLNYKDKAKFMMNGYQSWTETKAYDYGHTMKDLSHLPKWLLNKYKLSQYGDYHIAKYKKQLIHGFTYATVRDEEQYTLIGSYNDFKAYLIIYFDFESKEMILSSDVENRIIDKTFVLFDFIVIEGTHDQVFAKYLEKLPKAKKSPDLFGYTSWYNYYQNIDEEIVLRDLNALDQTYNVFQIDDGYQNYIGDWLDVNQDKFPNGLEMIQSKIKEKGFIPGIWMAPFVCEKNSELFKMHPNYIAKDDIGEMIFGGSNWSSFYALDLDNEDVKNYLRKCFDVMYNTYGFKLFKLDFLYAASLKSRTNKTRAESMHQAMMFVRECLPDAYILGCGMPLSSGFGIVDYCRIGPDVSLIFDDIFYMKLMHRERISTKNTILNTIYRRELDGHVFKNDPDVFILRSTNNKLNQAQMESLLYINSMFASVLLTSDQVSTYDEEQLKKLEKALKLKQANLVDLKENHKKVYITYVLNEQKYHFKYDKKKGVMSNHDEITSST
jgi:alpha-galactosidase